MTLSDLEMTSRQFKEILTKNLMSIYDVLAEESEGGGDLVVEQELQGRLPELVHTLT